MIINERATKIIVVVGIALCIVWLVLKIGNIMYNLCRSRKNRIPYLRNYKKGSFVSNYLVMLIIYFIGTLYDKQSFSSAFSNSITAASDFIVLKYNVESIKRLMNDSIIYRHLVYVGYVIVVVGAVLLAVSVMQQYIWSAKNSYIERKTRRENRGLSRIFKKDKLYLLGYNSDVLSVCESDGKRHSKYVVSEVDKDTRDALYIKNLPYLQSSPAEWIGERIDEFVRPDVKKSIFIVHTGDDKQNITICKCFADALASYDCEKCTGFAEKLRVFVFGDPKYQAIYQNLSEKGKGCIHYINKYKRIAADFIDRYPLALFMGENELDYSTALVKPGVNINMMLVGFGRVSRHIFLSSVACNQFVTAGKTGPVHKPVNYYIFDKSRAEEDKNLNHSYYRFKRRLNKMNRDDYLPLPPLPANEDYFRIDVNDRRFYDSIKQIVTKNPKDANFIVISYGNDLENLDMAHMLVEKCNEWEVNNVTIFVRAFEWKKEDTPLKDENCYFFGNEGETVFNIDKILSDKIYRMAKLRNEAFDVLKASPKRDNCGVNSKWYRNKAQIQRDSSRMACIGLRFKLNLMGLDYCDKSVEARGLSESEFNERYRRMATAEKHDPNLDTRTNLAIQEHYRWTSFAISKGMIPATLDQIQSESYELGDPPENCNGTNYKLRHHGNLTTFEGLGDFSKIISKRDHVDVNERDRLAFRYEILDDAYRMLTDCGFSIIEKKPCRRNGCDGKR